MQRKTSRRGKVGESKKLNNALFRRFRRRTRPWVIVNRENEPIGHFFSRSHAEDWHKESGEGDRYRIFKEESA